MTVEHLNLADLKAKTPAELLAMAEEWEIENAPSMRKGEMMFSILKELGNRWRRGAGSAAGRLWLSAQSVGQLSAGAG
jgi:transcription termination factor Rho